MVHLTCVINGRIQTIISIYKNRLENKAKEKEIISYLHGNAESDHKIKENRMITKKSIHRILGPHKGSKDFLIKNFII